jgi:predicted NBD/HSP70 family sugar kinase
MSVTPRGNRNLIRSINRSIILNKVKTSGLISRAEIARMTGLSPATVTSIAAELIAEGLIFEEAAGDSSGGRPPILLALNPQGGYVIGIKLAEKQAIGALTDLKASVIAKNALALPEKRVEKAVEVLVRLVKSLIAEGKIKADKLLGVGVGLAGIVDAEEGILRHSPILGWRDVPLCDLLQTRLGVPVYIDNDVNTLTLTEKWFGAGEKVDDFLAVTIGRGVGMGIVVNGRLYRGAKGGAGEFGHTVMDPNGPVCDCGKRGCLEAYVADPGLLRMAAEAVEKGEMEPVKTVEELLELARAGNPAAKAIFHSAGDMLGRGLANLITIFDPALIIISGEGVCAGDLLFDAARMAIEKHVMPGLSADTEIRVDAWDDDAWARGAAGLVLQKLFESPIHRKRVDIGR